MAVAARLKASDSDFWNKKPPAKWTSDEIERLLRDSPWAKEITPTYTSLPPRTDDRTWSENPPIGTWGPSKGKKISLKALYGVTIRWESAEPIRNAQKTALPAVFDGYHVIGIFFRGDVARDLGPRPVDDLRLSAVLSGKQVVDTVVCQPYPGVRDGFLIGFPKTSMNDVRHLEFSVRVGLLALTAKFDTSGMLYRGQLAL